MKNSNCLVLGCGPSLSILTGAKLKQLSETHTIMAIKQAYNLAPSLIDYHFINDNNYNHYDYTFSNAKVIAEFPANNFVPDIAKTAHTIFSVDNTDYNKSLSKLKNFEEWIISKQPSTRPWGPGIMYELVLFYAEHLGFKNIYTVGWDLGPIGSRTRSHYYTHGVINKAATLSEDEAANEIELTRAFYEWLKTKNINLFVCSDSYAHADIPRAEL